MKRNICFLVSDKRFKYRTLIYTLCYTHLHISMMLMQCLNKKPYNVTPRVLQIYPPKTKSRPEISYAQCEKEIGNTFLAQQLTIRAGEKVGVMLEYVALLFPRGFIFRMILPLHLVEFYHSVPGHSLLLIQDFDRALHIR